MNDPVAVFANILLLAVFILGFLTAMAFCKFWLYRQEIRRGRSFSMVVHQLKSPLAAIKWTVDMMQKGELGPVSEDQKTFLNKSADSIDRMSSMIFDILEAHSLIESPDPYEMKETDLSELVQEVVSEFRRIADHKSVKIAFSPGADETPVLADKKKVRVIVENLIDNAVKYSQDSGTVEVSLLVKDSLVFVSVKDHGIGIPPEDQEKIFGKYFRGANAKSHESTGSGLGLYIAREVAKRHGGDIVFNSEPGNTEFLLSLPLAS